MLREPIRQQKAHDETEKQISWSTKGLRGGVISTQKACVNTQRQTSIDMFFLSDLFLIYESQCLIVLVRISLISTKILSLNTINNITQNEFFFQVLEEQVWEEIFNDR